MNAKQLHMFPQVDNQPMLGSTTTKGNTNECKPRVVKSQARFCVCPTCHNTGRINHRGTTLFCTCEAGQHALARATLEALPTSRRVERLSKFYAGRADDSRKVLGEALKMDPPATRLSNLGARALLTHELVSLVLGTTKDSRIATRMLAEIRNIAKVQAFSVKELAGLVPGITIDRACRLLAALELAERVRAPSETQAVVKSPADAAEVVRDMSALEQEQMRVILLDTKNKVIHTTTVYQGSVHTTVIRLAEVMKAAVRVNATAIVLAHNHPSGDPTPSPEDVAVTREIVNASKLLDIDCLDHIVIGEAGKYVSLKERGLGFGS